MKVSYSEGLANHTGSKSRVVARVGGSEALTGEGAGRVFSSESVILRRKERRKTTSGAPIQQGAFNSRAVTDPLHVPKHLAWEPGDPALSQSRIRPGTLREA